MSYKHTNYHLSTFWMQKESKFLLMQQRYIKTKTPCAACCEEMGRRPADPTVLPATAVVSAGASSWPLLCVWLESALS